MRVEEIFEYQGMDPEVLADGVHHLDDRQAFKMHPDEATIILTAQDLLDGLHRSLLEMIGTEVDKRDAALCCKLPADMDQGAGGQSGLFGRIVQ